MLCEILYPENSDKARFDDLKKCAENDYVLNKAEYPRTVTSAKSILLKYQPNYESNRNSQPNRVRNQIMFAQHRETEDGEGDGKERIIRDPG